MEEKMSREAPQSARLAELELAVMRAQMTMRLLFHGVLVLSTIGLFIAAIAIGSSDRVLAIGLTVATFVLGTVATVLMFRSLFT
jgi:hypothetical protein